MYRFTDTFHTVDNVVPDYNVLCTEYVLWDNEVLCGLGIDACLNSANCMIVEELVEELELADAL